MANRTLKVAMAQMLVEGGQLEANLRRAESMIARAADQKCDVIVLPEVMDLGWMHPSARDLAQPIPGKISDRLCAAARKHSIHVASGITEREGEKFYNAAILISPVGAILLKHRKINELDIAHELYSMGDRLGVAHTPLGAIGLNICADNFADSQVLGHSQARMGAEIILSPSAWAVPPDHDNAKEPYGSFWEHNYSQLARWYDLPVIGVSNVGWITDGAWKGWKCIGCSLAVGGDGKVLLKGDYGDAAEALYVVELDLTPRTAKGTQFSALLKSRGYAGF